MAAVLLVSNDAGIQQLVRSTLVNAGHEVIVADETETAVRYMFSVLADVLIVDTALGLDNVQGLSDWLRSRGGEVGTVFLVSAQVRGDLMQTLPGHDEIVVKPFTADDLRRAVERVMSGERSSPDVREIGDLELDRTTLELRNHGRAVGLTATEFRMIEYMAQRRGKIVPTKELLENVWGLEPEGHSPQLVRAHMRNLRSKLKEVDADPGLIKTVSRVGYRLL